MRIVSYRVGDEVEVIGKEAGFQGSYFEATVLSRLDDGRYEVQYKNLIEDYASYRPLKEVFLPQDLRPKPPQICTRNGKFERLQYVDVYANEGWWKGRIIGTMACDGRPDVYMVHFCTPKYEYLEYHSSLIRVHQDFVEGTWSTPMITSLFY